MELRCGAFIISGALLCFASVVSAQVGGVAIGLGGGDFMVDSPFGEIPSPLLAMAAQGGAGNGPTTVPSLIPPISGDAVGTGTHNKPVSATSSQIGNGFNPSDVLSVFAGTGPGIAINPTDAPGDYVVQNPPIREQPSQIGVQNQGTNQPATVQIDPITGKEYTLQNEAYTPMGSVGHLVKVPVKRNDKQNVPQTDIVPASDKAATDHVIIEPVVKTPQVPSKGTQQSAPANTADQKSPQLVSDRFNPGSGMADEIAALRSSTLLGSPVDMSNFLPPPFNPGSTQSSAEKAKPKPGSISIPFKVPVISEFTVDRNPQKGVNSEVLSATGKGNQANNNQENVPSDPRPARVNSAAGTKSNQGFRLSLRDMFSGGQTLDSKPGANNVVSRPDSSQNKTKDIPHLQDLTAEGLFPFEGNSMARDATLPASKGMIKDMNKAISKHNMKESLHLENRNEGINEIPPLTGTNGGPITNMVGAKPPSQTDQNKESTSPTGLPIQDAINDKSDSKAPGSFIIGARTPNGPPIQTGLVSNPVSPPSDSNVAGGIALGGAIPEQSGISLPQLADQAAAAENIPSKENSQKRVDKTKTLPPPFAPSEIVPSLPSETLQSPPAKEPTNRILNNIPSSNELGRLLSLSEGTSGMNNNIAVGFPPSKSPQPTVQQRPSDAAVGKTITSEPIQGSIEKVPTGQVLGNVPSTDALNRLLSLPRGQADTSTNIGLGIPSMNSVSDPNQRPVGSGVDQIIQSDSVQSSPSESPSNRILTDIASTETLNRLLSVSRGTSDTNNNVGLVIPSIDSLSNSNQRPVDAAVDPMMPSKKVQGSSSTGPIDRTLSDIPSTETLNRLLTISQDPAAASNNVVADVPSISSPSVSNQGTTDAVNKRRGINVPVINLPDLPGLPSQDMNTKTDTLPPVSKQLSDPNTGIVPPNTDMNSKVGSIIQLPSAMLSPTDTPSRSPFQSPLPSQQIVNVKPGWLTNVFGPTGTEPSVQPDLGNLGLPSVRSNQVNTANNMPHSPDLSKPSLNPIKPAQVKDAVRKTLDSNIGPIIDMKQPADFIDPTKGHSTIAKKPGAVDIIPLRNRLLQPNRENGVFSLGVHRVIDTMPSIQPIQQINLPDYLTQNIMGTSETKPLVPDGNTQLNNIQLSSMSITPRREELRRMMMQQDARLAMASPEKLSQDSRSVLTPYEAPGMSFGQAVPVQETMKRSPHIVTITAESNVPVTDNKPAWMQQPTGMANDASNVKNTPLSFQLGLAETIPSDPRNQQNFLFDTAPDLGQMTGSQGVPGSTVMVGENPSVASGLQISRINMLDSFASGTRLGKPVATPNAKQVGTIQMIGNSVLPDTSGMGGTLSMGITGNIRTGTDQMGKGIMLPMSANTEANQFKSSNRQAVFGGNTNDRPPGTGIREVNRPVDYNINENCNNKARDPSPYYFKERIHGIEYRSRCPLGTKFDPLKCLCSIRINASDDCLQVHMDFNNGIVEDSAVHKLPIGNENVVVTNKSNPSNGIALFNSSGKLTIWKFQNYDFRNTVMLKVQFRPSQIGDRFQPLISNCDGDIEGPSIGIIYDSLTKELFLQLKTINETKRTLRFNINPDVWNDVTYIYDGAAFIGIVNGIRRYVSRHDPHLLGIIGGKMDSIPTTGLIEIRDAALILGHCPTMGYYNGAMVDIQVYSCIPKNFRLEEQQL